MDEIADGENKLYEFKCAPGTQCSLCGTFQRAKYSINDTGSKWVPQTTLDADEAYAKKIRVFRDSLEEHPEIIAVYTNLA